jgi:predicted amidohydrolase YtcJ
VANTAALRLAGQPSDGDGILREEQIQAVSTAVAARQAPIDPATARQVLAGLVSLGLGRLTAIVSATDPLWCEVPDEIGTLLEVGRDIPLDFDVLIIASKPEHLDEAAARIDSSPGRFTFLGLKDFADGSLGGRTAALYEPYTDDPANRGVVRLVPERTAPVARRCLEMGGTVAIHAIGDVANDRVLDLFEDLIAAGADPARLRIEHASVLTGEGLDRMANLGVTASVQPAFITSETSWLGARLGARVSRTYALGRMTAKGIPLVGGSDCPVEAPDPFAGMAAAAGPEGLTPEQALALFSQPLRVGDAADFIVLDRDPMGSAGSAGTKVLAAFRAGREVTLTPETPFR